MIEPNRRRRARLSLLVRFRCRVLLSAWAGFAAVSAAPLAAQDGPAPPVETERRGPERGGPPPGGPMGRAPLEVVSRFDKNGNGRLELDREERRPAREYVKERRAAEPSGPGGFRPGGPPGGGGPGRRFGGGGRGEPPKPGPRVSPADVAKHAGVPFYDTSVLRTLFLEFENADWEEELALFRDTDVEVPAKLVVDGNEYPGVGVRFRGASSYFMVGSGYKRSLNVSVDWSDEKQKVDGVRTLNLLNSNGDPTFLRCVLYSIIARAYLPAPKANLVKVVINGESWGVYVNTQQFNKDFVAEWFPSGKGARFKVPGSPRGGGGLVYRGDDPAEYARQYELKSDGGEGRSEAYRLLIDLCRTLGTTPAEELESKLPAVLDVDGALRFLAVENVLMNSDGYWTRASDFSLYRDPSGVFHVIPHDMNEALGPVGGPGGFRGGPPPGAGAAPPGEPTVEGRRPDGAPPTPPGGPPGSGGFKLDPLAGADDPGKPLLHRLLAVPAWREKYLGYVRSIAEEWLDWRKLEPIVAAQRALIEKEVAADTRKIDSLEAFRRGVGLESGEAAPPSGEGGGRRHPSLREFAEGRRSFLLDHPAIRKPRTAAADGAGR